VLLIFAIGLSSGCFSRPRYRSSPPGTDPKKTAADAPVISTKDAFQVGFASYYAHKFHGRPTASGEIYNMYGLSAAHRELPLGTVIHVTHLGNGRSVKVKVNDRGPFVEGRILDLSLGAARRLGMVEEGVARVKIRIIKAVD
jgi:rare lipoprotein A